MMFLFIIALIIVLSRVSENQERRLNERRTRALPAAGQTTAMERRMAAMERRAAAMQRRAAAMERRAANLPGKVFEAEDIGPSGGFTVK